MAKIREIKLARRNGFRNGALRPDIPATTVKMAERLSALENQNYEMAKGLEEFVNEMNNQLDFILDQQAEANLRVLFIMQFHKFKKESPILGAEGVAQVQTMYDIYLESRDKFKAQIEEQLHVEREKLERQAAAARALEPPSSLASDRPADADSASSVVAPGSKLVS